MLYALNENLILSYCVIPKTNLNAIPIYYRNLKYFV